MIEVESKMPALDETFVGERRSVWRCSIVLDGGEGPTDESADVKFASPSTAKEAAEKFVRDRDEWIAFSGGGPAEHGDVEFVAVETTPGRAVFFSVTTEVVVKKRAARFTPGD